MSTLLKVFSSKEAHKLSFQSRPGGNFFHCWKCVWWSKRHGYVCHNVLISVLQTERSYQKQPTIFQNKKRVLTTDGGKEGKEKIPRYHKSVGLGFKTPREVTRKCWRNCQAVIKLRICSPHLQMMPFSRWSSKPVWSWRHCLLAILMQSRVRKITYLKFYSTDISSLCL